MSEDAAEVGPMRKKTRREPGTEAKPISFSARTVPPFNQLSNFFGGAELEFMAARFEHPALKHLLLDTFATCTVSEFRSYFKLLHPSGKASTYIYTTSDGTQLPIRGILGRLAGTAAVSSSSTAKTRMGKLRRLAGIAGDEAILTNTKRILSDAGLQEDSSAGERLAAIDSHNEVFMRQCLERKFRKGHVGEGDVNFRQLLLQTGGRRLRESSMRGGGKWCARGDDDGLLGKMLVDLRERIRADQHE